MSYPQQPDNWSDPSWPSQTPGFDPKATYGDPASAPVSGPQPNPYADPSAAPVSGQQPGAAGYPTGYPTGYPGGYPTGYPGGYAYPVAPPQTNGMAIASMVVSIIGVFGLCGYGLGGYLGILGAILGHVSRKQIRERGENGDGMALSGIILGWISTAIAVIATALIVIFVVWAANQESSNFDSNY